jgi:hypothetical protein
MISALKALFEKPAKESGELQQHRLRVGGEFVIF